MPLSAKQMEYLALAWQCFDSEPKIDFNKFATVAGLKSAASARELMRVTKNKLKDEYGALSNTMQSTNGATSPIKSPSKKPTGTPKKATTAATPGPKKRARKAADVEADVDADGTDDDSEPSPAGKKAKAATPAAKGAKVVKTEPDQENGLAGDEDVNFF